MGDQLETGRSEQDAVADRRKDLFIKIALFLGLVVITVAAFPRGEMYEYTVDVGDTWRRPTLVAPFNFPVYKDQETVQKQREQARRETPPYFRELPDTGERITANRDTLNRQLEQIYDAYASFRFHQMRGQPKEARTDSARYVELRRNARLKATPAQWQTLMNDHTERLPELSATSREPPSGPRLDERLLDASYELSMQLISVGVMNLSRDSIRTDEIIVRNDEERVQRTVSKDNVYGLNEAYSYVQSQLQERFSERPEYADLGYSFFRAIFQPSLRYLRAETLQERERRANKISIIQGGIEQGDIIVSNGERVTPEVKRQLTSLERVRAERSASSIVWKQLGGELTLTLIIYLIFFLFVYFIRQEIFQDNKKLLLVTLVFAAIVALFGVTVRLEWASLYVVPVALAAVQLTIVFDARLALIGTLTLACIGGAMLGLDLEFTLATFVAGMLGIYSVRDIKNRGQFFLTTLLVFAGYVVVLGASWLYLGTPAEMFGREVMFAAIGSAFTVVSQFMLWILERSFDVTTDLTLLELSDTNRPLLKKLSLRAPGTFNHSLQVANLAEAAADRIGANALLTRVGALYHDIGKMLKPEYFVENQRTGSNPHDQLKPRMSALIIASHVKEGVEMAKEYGLPRRVLHFIPTHHGTSRIEYFYRKAVEQTEEDDSPVMESEFRYPGPRPDSRETGVLMLADSVEAASRSLDEPTHNRLKSLIDLIVREHIEDGQLDHTDLTFRDITQIKDTFLSMLTGIYHVRVKYPDQEQELPEADAIETIVETEDMPMTNGISVRLEGNIWGSREQGVSAEQLRQLPGVRDPRAPRTELAEASPYRSHPGTDAGREASTEEDLDETSSADTDDAPPEEPDRQRK